MTHTNSMAIPGRRSGGVTLIEMLVAIVIVGILAAIAAPSFQRLIVDTRMSSQANDFLTMLTFTRSEAVKRNTRVTMCKSSDGATCTTDGGWEQGWIIFVDGSTAGDKDGTDEVLRVHGVLSDSSSLVPTVANSDIGNYISYMPNGQTRTAANGMQGGTLKLCSNIASINGRSLVITTGPGRARVDSAHPGCS